MNTGLVDSEGRQITIGDVVECATGNSDVHGEWIRFRVASRGMTPVLLYLISEAGAVLPAGYSGRLLCDSYDRKQFLFRPDLGELKPSEHMEVLVCACGNSATCHGTYEGTTAFSCDTCCGHGCEDGHCEPLITD